VASVFRRPQSKYWYAGWRGGDGKFHLRSTKQTDRSKGLAVALEWERVDKKLTNGELVEAQIRDVVNDLLDRVGESKLETPSIRSWFNDWVADKEANRSAGTAVRYKGVVDCFLDSLVSKAEKPLSVLVAQDIQKFAAERKKAGVSSATINLEVKIIRTALNRARRQGVISVNSAEAVDLPAKRSIEKGVFSEAEVAILLKQAQGTDWETVITFGYYTAARLSDCVKMQWEHMDLAGEKLTFYDGKNSKWITLPMHPKLLAHLTRLASVDVRQKFVTPRMSAFGSGGRRGLSEGFKRIVTAAGLDLQTVQGNGIRMISKRTFHSLRHSFTSALANAGVSDELRMKLTGHKSVDVHRGYTHLEMKTLREAINKL